MPMTSAAESLDLLLWRVGLCWQAPRAPQQASCMGDAVIAAASPLAQSEKCQGFGDSVPGHEEPFRPEVR